MTPASANRQRRLQAAGRFLLFVLLYLVFHLAFSLLAALVFSSLPGFDSSSLLGGVLVTVLGGLAGVCLATALMVGAVENRGATYVGLGLEPGWLTQLAWGAAAGLAMMAAVIALEWAGGFLRISASGSSASAAATQLLLFFLLFLAGAAHEELLFRGYAFQRLVQVLGAPPAVLLLAGAFGAVHYRNPHAGGVGALNTVLVGILFALAYLATRRLWFPIGLHWSWNFFEAAFGFPVSGIRIEGMPLVAVVSGPELFHGGDYGPEASLMASGVFVAATAILWWRRKRPGRGASSNEVA